MSSPRNITSRGNEMWFIWKHESEQKFFTNSSKLGSSSLLTLVVVAVFPPFPFGCLHQTSIKINKIKILCLFIILRKNKPFPDYISSGAGFITKLFLMLYFATATGTAILSTRQESASCRFSEVFDIFQYFRLSNSVNMQWTDADL